MFFERKEYRNNNVTLTKKISYFIYQIIFNGSKTDPMGTPVVVICGKIYVV